MRTFCVGFYPGFVGLTLGSKHWQPHPERFSTSKIIVFVEENHPLVPELPQTATRWSIVEADLVVWFPIMTYNYYLGTILGLQDQISWGYLWYLGQSHVTPSQGQHSRHLLLGQVFHRHVSEMWHVKSVSWEVSFAKSMSNNLLLAPSNLFLNAAMQYCNAAMFWVRIDSI